MSCKVIVPVKRVIDAYVKVRVKSDHSGVETANVKMSMNPFDEIAVEEAIRLKETGLVDEIIAVSLGTDQSQDVLRTALALGADRAILIRSAAELQPLAVANCLKVIVEREQANLVIMGKQAIDDDCGQTGQMLAAKLDWPHASFASEVVIADNTATVTCEVDGGLRTLSMPLPALITTDLRLNEPRYASLPNIMKAKKKPLDILEISELNVDVTPRIQTLKVEPPVPRQAGIKVADVAELVDKLRNDAQVID